MPRATNAPASRARRKKVLKMAKGARGARSKLYRTAVETVNKGLAYSFRDRKAKKIEFRQLWIARIKAAVNEKGISYSRFMDGLKKESVGLDRKMLADLAITESETFGKLVEMVQS